MALPAVFGAAPVPQCCVSACGKPVSSTRLVSSAVWVLMRPALGTARHRLQEALDGAGGDVGSLRLRVVPGFGHHDDLCMQGAADPVSLGARVGEVWVLLAHHDKDGSCDV